MLDSFSRVLRSALHSDTIPHDSHIPIFGTEHRPLRIIRQERCICRTYLVSGEEEMTLHNSWVSIHRARHRPLETRGADPKVSV